VATDRLPADTDSTDDAARFGTDAFYASLGRAFVAMCAVIPVLFAIELLDWWLRAGFDVEFGIRPGRLDGLDGVLLGPFLHVDFVHLYSNSVPLILLGTFVLAAGARRFLLSTVVIALVSGLGVWFLGEPGSVVVTDLTNRAMPILRYQVGDVAVWSDQVCPCGRGLPLLERIDGREADYVVTARGELISGISLTENFALHVPGVA